MTEKVDTEIIGDVAHCAEKIYERFNDKEIALGFVTVIVGAGASNSITTNDLKDGLHSKSLIGWDVFETNAIANFGKEAKTCTLEQLFSILSKIKARALCMIIWAKNHSISVQIISVPTRAMNI
jgi:hypothetical protein